MIIDTAHYFSSTTPAESKREKTHLKLIDASIDLLYEKGFHHASIKEICEISGVANGTFYNHFIDKEDIYSQSAMYISRVLAAHVNLKKSEVRTPADVVITGHLEYINFLSVRPKWAAVLLQSTRGHYGRDVWSLNKRRISADVKKGITAEVFPIKFDPFLIDQIMQIVLHSIGQQIIYAPSKTITKKASIAIMRLLKYEES